MLKSFKIVGIFWIAHLASYLYSQSQNGYHYHYYYHNGHYHYYLHQNQNNNQSNQTNNHNHDHSHDHNHGQTPNVNHQHGFESLAEVFESPERAKWQKPDKVIEVLGDLSDKTVADLGAGTGYFTFRLVKVAKKVIALDTSSYFIQYIQNKRNTLPKPYQDRLITRLISYSDSGLQNQEVDILLAVDVYHHIENRVEYFQKIWSLFPEGGKVVIVDFKENSTLPGGPPKQSRLSFKQVVNELHQSGFKSIQASKSILEHQYIVIAKK
ncbi:MAG: methyltransferase domain-containing protein [Leptospiraceae bacterium]|nr:methyltransferase domain-containing protein [Leptospiraceae bacterium]MCP5496612.1 methyltransferase domain-containing protein [Leptospiraceae bacterium]